MLSSSAFCPSQIFAPGPAGRKPADSTRVILTTFAGVLIGFLIGVSFPTLTINGFNLSSGILPTSDEVPTIGVLSQPPLSSLPSRNNSNISSSSDVHHSNDTTQGHTLFEICEKVRQTPAIWVSSNPSGAERLPPDIVVAESDLYLHRLWGNPDEDLTIRQKYLVTFTVGYNQRNSIDAAVKKFSENFTIVLFHYDGRVTEWDEFEWSKRAIHVSAPKQTKWWYAKRFFHPDIVAPYDYLFIWDEDLGVEHFDAEEYIKLVKKHGLEISQPGIESKRITWKMTQRRNDKEVHKETDEKPGRCPDKHLPPCAAFIEIMAPVFSRDAWQCVWHMLQNDLVHGWGIDFALRKCVEPAHDKIGVVDAQWVIHQALPSLGNQGEAHDGKAPWQGVRDRCKNEWKIFNKRLGQAEMEYLKATGIDPSKLQLT